TTVPWPLALQSKRRSLSKTFCRTFRTLSAMGVAGGVLLGNAIAGMFGGSEAQAAERPAPQPDEADQADDASSDNGGDFGDMEF
ncbi:DUF2076 domain-containing protein, partial [Mesorhizobium sp. M0115]